MKCEVKKVKDSEKLGRGKKQGNGETQNNDCSEKDEERDSKKCSESTTVELVEWTPPKTQGNEDGAEVTESDSFLDFLERYAHYKLKLIRSPYTCI